MCLECDAGGPAGGSPTVAPEASGGTWDTDFQRFHQVTWTSPVTSRLLGRGGLCARPNEVRSSKRRRRSHSDHRTGRRHPGADISIGRLAPQSNDDAALACVPVVRHRLTQHEGRVRGSVLVHERWHILPIPLAGLSLQQRCAQPADHASESPAEQRPRQRDGALRSGFVESRPDIGAGSGSIRSRVELQRGRAVRAVAVRDQPDGDSRHQGDRCRTTTSHCGAGWRTTCSATARPRCA